MGISRQQKIDLQTLLRRYTVGDRNFSNLVVHPTYTGEVIDLTDVEDREGFFAALHRDYFMRGVDLSDINLSDSVIDACFDGVILHQANLINTKWCACPSEDIDFTGANISGLSTVDGGIFVCCNFTDVIYDETTDFYKTDFYGCTNDCFEKSRWGDIDEIMRSLPLSRYRYRQ